MNFCTSCGAIIQKRDGDMLICSCSNKQAPASGAVTEKMKQGEELKVFEQGVHPLATYDHVCAKCGFDKAQLVTKGHWYGDEDEAIEFICGKCSHHELAEGIRAK